MENGSALEDFIAYLAKFQNPLDNPINSIVAKNYDDNVASLNLEEPISTEQKFWAIGKAVYDVSAQAIRNSFFDNGLRVRQGNPETSQSVMSRLIGQGVNPSKKYLEMHCEQLEAYLSYHLSHHFDIPLQSSPLGDRLQGPLFNILNKYIRIQRMATQNIQ